MLNTIRISLLTMLLGTMFLQNQTASATTERTLEQVVAAFQKIPHYEMFCKEVSWADRDLFKESGIFKTLLSQEFYKLFVWSQCWVPETPPHYGPLEHFINFDIRYSIPNDHLVDSGKTIEAKNIRIGSIKQKSKNQVTLIVQFASQLPYYKIPKMLTIYTLILENGQWKIDDIAPQAGSVKGSDQEYIGVSDSIKTDMQNNYNAAMERYKQEQAKKGVTNKK